MTHVITVETTYDLEKIEHEEEDCCTKRQFFVTCLNQDCTNIFVQLDIDSGVAKFRVSQSIMYLPVEHGYDPYYETTDEEYHYVDICTPSRVNTNEDETGESSFCNNINTTLPYLYVEIEPLYPGNMVGQLKLFNIENVTEGSKYVIDKPLQSKSFFNLICSFVQFVTQN